MYHECMDDSEYVKACEAPISEAKRLQAVLEGRGVIARLASDPEHCNSCSPKVALYVRPGDLETFHALLREEHHRSLGDLTHDAKLVDAVFDEEKDEATCPACGTVFSTQLTECPDCGLGFGAV